MSRVSPLERVLETMLAFISQYSASTLVWCILQCGYFGMAPTSCPALLLKALPGNIGVPSLVNLLSNHSKGNLSLGIFGRLEKISKISIWSVL